MDISRGRSSVETSHIDVGARRDVLPLGRRYRLPCKNREKLPIWTRRIFRFCGCRPCEVERRRKRSQSPPEPQLQPAHSPIPGCTQTADQQPVGQDEGTIRSTSIQLGTSHGCQPPSTRLDHGFPSYFKPTASGTTIFTPAKSTS